MIYIVCFCNTDGVRPPSTQPPTPLKKLNGSGRFGKVAKIALGGDRPLATPLWLRLWTSASGVEVMGFNSRADLISYTLPTTSHRCNLPKSVLGEYNNEDLIFF